MNASVLYMTQNFAVISLHFICGFNVNIATIEKCTPNKINGTLYINKSQVTKNTYLRCFFCCLKIEEKMLLLEHVRI